MVGCPSAHIKDSCMLASDVVSGAEGRPIGGVIGAALREGIQVMIVEVGA